jgi:hypothetical protein
VLLFLFCYAFDDVPLPLVALRPFDWRWVLGGTALVAAARHVRHPQPWCGAVVWSALRRWFWDDGGSFVLQVGLASRVAVLAIAISVAAADVIPSSLPRVSSDPYWNALSRWDAFYYLDVAMNGYQWDPSIPNDHWNVAFFPGFPIAQRLAGAVVTMPLYVFHNNTWLGGGSFTRLQLGGVLLSIGAFLFGLAAVFRLARRDIGDDRAKWAILLLAYFPFALFYSVPYTEGLFFLAIAAAFLAGREERPIAMFVWGVIAGLTRQTGMMVTFPLLLLAGEPWWSAWRSGAVRPPLKGSLLVAASGPAVGLALHMVYLWSAFGDPWAWMHAQKGWWHSASMFPFVAERIRAIGQYGWLGYFDATPGAALGTLIPICALALLSRAWRLSPAYAVLVVVTLVPAIAIDTPSIGRLAAPLFPLFIALAAILPMSRHNWIVTLVFGASQLWAASAFFQWRHLY